MAKLTLSFNLVVALHQPSDEAKIMTMQSVLTRYQLKILEIIEKIL